MGDPESSKSAILDGKQLLVKNQVFRRSRELKLGYFRWKTAVYIKFGVFRNFLFFWPKSWFLFKNSKMATFWRRYIFIARKGLFYMKNITKIILKHILRKNEERNFPILGQKSWVNPFVINPKWRFLPKVYLHSLGRRILYQEH